MTSPVIDQFGHKHWYNEAGLHHREDGPAMEYKSGYKAWYIKGKRHREDGPAREWQDGFKEFFIDGKHYSETEYNRIMRCSICSKFKCPTKSQ